MSDVSLCSLFSLKWIGSSNWQVLNPCLFPFLTVQNPQLICSKAQTVRFYVLRSFFVKSSNVDISEFLPQFLFLAAFKIGVGRGRCFPLLFAFLKKSDGERLVIVSVSSYSKSHRGCLVSQIFLRKIIQCRYISICGKRYPCLLCSLPSQKTIASAHGCFSLFCSKPVLYLFNVLEFISKITQYLNTRFCGSRYPYFWQSQRRAAGNFVCFCPLGLLKNHDNTP